ncbi:MAG: hypothetical protein CMJ59_15180 [Planctomycetaceae bacterium]|nr:hypothetical protein [Planctomycetaceae bacterium]
MTFQLTDRETRLCDGLPRRELLRVGGISLGALSLGSLLAQRGAGAPRRGSFGRAKSVILFGLMGGTPQHETWDPKPDAPAEIRGEFGVIDSATPGLRVGELMPRTAKMSDKIAVLRAVVSGDNSHSSSGYQMLTGMPHQPLNRESALPKPPNDWPSMGALVRALRDGPGRLPASITLPEHIWNDGNFPWPGQDAGFLGRRNDPWLIHCHPQEGRFDFPGLARAVDMPSLRFDQRRRLLDQMNTAYDRLEADAVVSNYTLHARKALDLLTGSQARAAFDLGQETEETRARYGKGRFAQSCLLARRLVESGVCLVQVNWTRIKGYENQGGWDTHKKHCESLKKLLMPRMDQCFTALLEDLEQRGLLDETLVVWIGEFGHTPKINANAGRDHWGHSFSLALAGGGIRGGTVHGISDAHAAYPVDGVVRPRDVIATVFHCLGYPPHAEVHDPLGRPLAITRGKVIDAIL